MTAVLEPEVEVEAPQTVLPGKGKPKTVADGLYQASLLIEKGWTKFQLWNETRTEFCSVGALLYAYDEEGWTDEAERAKGFLVHQIGLDDRGYPFSHTLAQWNNAPERQQGEVVQAFRSAAKAAEQKGI